MASPPEHPATVSWRPLVFVLRDDADLRRLRAHLLTHWALPEVDFRVERLPARESHRAQDLFTRLAAACNCLVGELLGGAAVIIGACVAWATTHVWRSLGLALVIALWAALLGKGLEFVWTRARLLWVLRDLRYQLTEVNAGRSLYIPETLPETRSRARALDQEAGDVLHVERVARRRATATIRPRMLLGSGGDVGCLALYLLAHWRLPHMQIGGDGLPALITQRAQERLTRLSAGYSYLPAAVLAVLTFLGGAAAMLWPRHLLPEEIIMWTMHRDLREVALTLAATAGAALLGWLCEVLWVRLRLLWVLSGVWWQMQKRVAG